MVNRLRLIEAITVKNDITMKQKIIWKPFLIIGLSLVTIFTKSCDKGKTIHPIKTVQYIYKNQSQNDLVMFVYSQTRTLIDTYNIATNAQIITNTTKLEGPTLFYYDSDMNSIGDSIVIKFSSNQCLYWTKKDDDKIFKVSEYDNYSEELLKEKEYKLEFSIKQSDFDQAIDCK